MPLIVTADYPPPGGGIQRYTHRLAAELHRRGHPVTVIAPASPGDVAFDAGAGFRVVRYRAGGAAGRLAALIAEVARVSRNDVTIASSWNPAGIACSLPRLRGRRLAVLAHGSEIVRASTGWRRPLMRAVLSRATVVVANSRFTAALLRDGGAGDNVAVVACGIDAAAGAPRRPASVPTILSVGRLVRRKGFDRVIAALPALRRRFPNVRYEIVGAGPQRAELEALAAALGVTGAVAFAGEISDAGLADAYARAWCFALPVRREGFDVEGFGIVYLEAAAAGLASIGGRASGAVDAIVDGETGFLVDGNDPAAIERALGELLADPELRARFGDAGRTRALRDFTWERNAAEIARLMDLEPA